MTYRIKNPEHNTAIKGIR